MTGKQATLEALGLSVNEKGEIQTKAISPSMPAIDIDDIGTTRLGGINWRNYFRPNDLNKIQKRRSIKCALTHCHYSPIKGEMAELEKRK